MNMKQFRLLLTALLLWVGGANVAMAQGSWSTNTYEADGIQYYLMTYDYSQPELAEQIAGIPEEILVEHPERCVRIPMMAEERSLNLSNAVAVALYEALRHIGYGDLEKTGKLHRLAWEDTP